MHLLVKLGGDVQHNFVPTSHIIRKKVSPKNVKLGEKEYEFGLPCPWTHGYVRPLDARSDVCYTDLVYWVFVATNIVVKASIG